ncbi:MAG: molybdenum cofactor guanylyltransferase [Terriglobales bacterium]
MPASNQPARAAYLQVGGKSTRMGRNKAFIDFQGEILLARAIRTLTESCGEVTIVGDPRIFARYGRVISDIFPNCGPLGGIHAALTDARAELNLMLAVDMPFVTAELVKFLFDAAGDTQAAVTVPRTSRGLQPLCAVYRREFAGVAEQALKAGNYKIDAAFAEVSIRVIAEPELAAAGFSETSFFNVNTPEDCRAADLIP